MKELLYNFSCIFSLFLTHLACEAYDVPEVVTFARLIVIRKKHLMILLMSRGGAPALTLNELLYSLH